MTHKQVIFGVMGLVGVVGLGGCDGGGEDYDTPTAEEYDELAEVTAMALVNDSGGDVESMRVAVEVGTSGELPVGFEGEVGSFEATFYGVVYSYAVGCLSQAGGAVDCGSSQVDGAETAVYWGGGMDTTRFDASFAREGEWRLSGLSALDPVFNGRSTFSIDTSFDAVWWDRAASYHLEYEAVYTDVQLDASLLLPLSGDITYTLYADRSAVTGDDVVEASFRVGVEIRFVSAGMAQLILDGAYAYTIDLDSGTVMVAR